MEGGPSVRAFLHFQGSFASTNSHYETFPTRQVYFPMKILTYLRDDPIRNGVLGQVMRVLRADTSKYSTLSAASHRPSSSEPESASSRKAQGSAVEGARKNGQTAGLQRLMRLDQVYMPAAHRCNIEQLYILPAALVCGPFLNVMNVNVTVLGRDWAPGTKHCEHAKDHAALKESCHLLARGNLPTKACQSRGTRGKKRKRTSLDWRP